MTTKIDLTEKRMVEEALELPDTQKRNIAVALLKSVQDWPNPNNPEFLSCMENAPPEEKQAALKFALTEAQESVNRGDFLE
jgi:hypothetical protein